MTNKIHLLFNECSDVFKRCNDETLTPSGSFPIGTAEIYIHTYKYANGKKITFFNTLLMYFCFCQPFLSFTENLPLTSEVANIGTDSRSLPKK